MIGQSVASDASPLSCYLFRPRKRLEKHRKALHKTPTQHAQSLTISAVIFILTVSFHSCFGHSPTNGSRSLSLPKASTHSPSPAKSHTAAHRGKQGVFSCAAAWWQEGMENWSGDKETRAGDDALQLAIAGPSRRSPAGLRSPVRNLAMLLVFRSVHRCQRLALLFLRLCRFEEPSCVRLHHSHLSLISAAQNILAFCSALGHRSNQPRGHLLQHHLPIDHMSHLRYSTSIPTGKRSIAPPANRRIIISIGNNTMSKANANIFIAPHVSCKTNPAALTNKYAHRVKSAISIIFTTPER